MDTKTFEFQEGYKLTVTERGFFLTDVKTDEVIVDASMMNSYWMVELSMSSTNRDFYIRTNDNLDDKVSMGISQRKV